MVETARGDLDWAAAWLERSLAGLRQLGDRATVALTLRSLGELHLRRDRRETARRLFLECVVVARELNDRDEAARCLEESVVRWRKLDMPMELARAVQSLGQAYLDAGSPAAAELAWREAVALFEAGTPEAEQAARRLELLVEESPASKGLSADRS
jgi:tetratricopeptide (TPR) repeat protein